jgi:hypothetical protein
MTDFVHEKEVPNKRDRNTGTVFDRVSDINARKGRKLLRLIRAPKADPTGSNANQFHGNIIDPRNGFVVKQIEWLRPSEKLGRDVSRLLWHDFRDRRLVSVSTIFRNFIGHKLRIRYRGGLPTETFILSSDPHGGFEEHLENISQAITFPLPTQNIQIETTKLEKSQEIEETAEAKIDEVDEEPEKSTCVHSLPQNEQFNPCPLNK